MKGKLAMDVTLSNLVEETMAYALRQGAREAAVSVGRARFVDLKRRDGRTEALEASTSRGLSLSLYVDGRYSSNSTSLLQPAQLRTFVEEAVALTRCIAPDPYRALPDPQLYGPTCGVELELEDAAYDSLTMERRDELVAAAEAAARSAGSAVLSVATAVATQETESLLVHSNGFRGERRSTSYILGATVTVRDQDGRLPEEDWWCITTHLADLPAASAIGEEAARRALGRLGSRKVQSERMTLLVENRAAGGLVSSLLDPLGGAALQQRRSCFEEKRGQAIGSPALTLADDPLLKRGLGSRTFDGEGLAARRLPLFSEGRLENYFIDVYYGRKLGLPPTTGAGSNVVLVAGNQSLEELVAAVDRGVLVTSFLGGNANAASGDFSFGILGQAIRHGQLEHAVGEMNITGSHLSLWQTLRAVGNDPYPYSALRIPSLLFEDVQFSGM